MNWLDLVILLFLLASVLRGRELGFVRQICSAIGVGAGLFVGVWLNSLFVGHIMAPQNRAVFALMIILSTTLVLMLVGEYAGLRLKFWLHEGRLTNLLDRSLGAVLGAVTVLLAVWLGAAVFRNLPVNGWQREIRESRIVAILNHELPSAPSLMAQLGHFLDPNGFPQVFAGLERTLPGDTPLPDMGQLTAAVQRDRASIVKVEGEGCGGIVEGSGFVADAGEVVTNAHVVAGVAKPVVLDTHGQHHATVIWFDPNLDVAILRVSGLAGGVLAMHQAHAPKGTPAAIAGYPGGGGFTAVPAAIIEAFTAEGRNIYNQGLTERSVYSLRGDVEQGNSGGPLIGADGAVLGLIFAKSTSYNQVGYALTIDQIANSLQAAGGRTAAVGTGSCAD